MTKNIKSFNERFSGWGTETTGGGTAGLEGYSFERAQEVACQVRAEMVRTRGILEIRVDVVKRPNGNYDVVNTSRYESYF